MELSTLRYFIAVAQLQHMTKAAQRLNITQPTLSVAIKRLESEVGCPLFDRVGRTVHLNENGKVLLRAALQVDEIMTDCLSELEECSWKARNMIRLCCSISPMNTAMIENLLAQKLPLQINTIPDEWEQALLQKECEFVITLGTTENPALESSMLHLLHVVIVCGRHHWLTNRKHLTLEDLRGSTFCSTDTNHSIHQMLAPRLNELNFHPYHVPLGYSSADVIRALRTSEYLSFMIEENLPGGNHLAVLPVEDFSAELPIYLYWLRATGKRSRMVTCREGIERFYRSADY